MNFLLFLFWILLGIGIFIYFLNRGIEGKPIFFTQRIVQFDNGKFGVRGWAFGYVYYDFYYNQFSRKATYRDRTNWETEYKEDAQKVLNGTIHGTVIEGKICKYF